MVLLNAPEDIAWVKAVHLRGVNLPMLMGDILAVVVHGDEDAPSQIDLYRCKNPKATTRYRVVKFTR